MHIRINDIVQVRTGDDCGTVTAPRRARVLRVLHAEGKVVVEGVNLVYKHMRRSQRNPQGGRLSKEMPINWSNVLLVCPQCNKATRTGARFLDDGAKERFCKKCGAGIGTISPARKKRETDGAKS